MHSFPDEGKLPHYEMAVDADDDTASAVMLGKQGSGVVARPEKPTELCLGPTRCQTGKTGIVKSSSSFQVSILISDGSGCQKLGLGQVRVLKFFSGQVGFGSGSV